MKAFLHGPYLNPEPWFGKVWVQELSNELRKISDLGYFALSPGPFCVLQQVHIQRGRKPVLDAGLGPMVLLHSKGKAVPVLSWGPAELFPALHLLKAAWTVAWHIWGWWTVNSLSEVSHLYLKASHVLTLMLKVGEISRRGEWRKHLHGLIWQLKIHKWKNCHELAQRAVINNILPNSCINVLYGFAWNDCVSF